jgi:hypothetical protein
MEGTVEGENRANVSGLLWLGVATILIILAALAYQWLAP